MFEQIDDALLEPTQKLSDWLHYWTGYDAIEQSRFFAGVAAVGWLMDILYFLRTYSSFDWWAAILLLGSVHRCFFENETDALVRSESKRGLRNRRRISLWFRGWRLFTVGAMAFCVWLLAFQRVILVGILASGMFEACDIQTPKSGRIRQFLNRLTHTKTLVLSPDQSCKCGTDLIAALTAPGRRQQKRIG